MVSSIPIGAKVICTDGEGGQTTALVVDPVSHTLSHIAVVEKSIWHDEERLVPIDRVVKTTRSEVHINCSKDELAKMEPFTRTHYLEMDQGVDGYAYARPYMSMYPDPMLSPEVAYMTIQDQLVPEGEVAINRGMAVEATDGYIGQVGELLIDPSGKVTHFLLMKGHGWGKKEVAIDVSSIARMEADTIYLQIDKEKIAQLPSLPVKRNWNEVFATDLELMVWTFNEKDAAQQAFQKVQDLCKQHELDVLNATVMEKNAKGEIHIHEDKKIPSKRRIALGIALGGLAGLVIGPLAFAAGAIAGAVAGKKSARKIEVGFSEDKLRKLNESLAPGGSALLLVVEHRWFHTLQLELSGSGGQLISERLADITFDELAERLSGAEEE